MDICIGSILIYFVFQVLFFEAYMKQTVHESAQEQYRVRFFRVFYYLEDDTISINEPEIENSGMVHGTVLPKSPLAFTYSVAIWHSHIFALFSVNTTQVTEHDFRFDFCTKSWD